MARKKGNERLFTDNDQEKNYIQYLKEQGYVVFKPGDLSRAEEEEAVKKLQAVGYRVEHPSQAVIKVDATKIHSVDDIAVYFHEMLRRHHSTRFNEKRLKDKKLREVDRSVINYFISWRVENGSSVREAIEDMFLLIDVLFEKKSELNLDIRGIGILSVNSNKPLVLSLLESVKIKKDAKLNFEIENLIKHDEAHNYIDTLQKLRAQMDEVGPSIEPVKRKKRKIKLR